MRITANSVVSIRFKMINSSGEVLEDIMEGPPVQYLHGSGAVLPALEAELEGLCIGENKVILLSTEKGYKEIDDSFQVDVIVDNVRMATDKEISEGVFYPKLDTGGGNYCAPDCKC